MKKATIWINIINGRKNELYPQIGLKTEILSVLKSWALPTDWIENRNSVCTKSWAYQQIGLKTEILSVLKSWAYPQIELKTEILSVFR